MKNNIREVYREGAREGGTGGRISILFHAKSQISNSLHTD